MLRITSRLRRAFALTIASLLAATAFAHSFNPSADGLYVVFETSKGEFAVKIHYDKVPVTAASFVGLAAGTIPHYVTGSDTPRFTPFYDGITVHRVVGDFVIQFGSPNGQGTDGPGYFFPDEIDESLKHNKVGVLSMANSGSNSNGSQVFLTLSATTATSLDGKHAIFGEIAAGNDILSAIGSVATDANGKPTTAVTINKATVVRKGTAAEAWDETAYAPYFDPDLADKPDDTAPQHPQIVAQDGVPYLSGPREALTKYKIEKSDNLTDWETFSVLEPSLLPEPTYLLSTLQEQSESANFFRVSEKRGRSIDKSGATIKIVVDDASSSTFTFSFEDEFSGEATYDSETGEIYDYRWYPLGERDQLIIASEVLRTLQVYFNWTSETGGDAFIRFIDFTNNLGQRVPGINLTGKFTVE